jgi:hypothetical protein
MKMNRGIWVIISAESGNIANYPTRFKEKKGDILEELFLSRGDIYNLLEKESLPSKIWDN